jgi:hypothetical protein
MPEITEQQLPIKLEPILQQIQAFVPGAEEKTAKAVAHMETLLEINDEDDLEFAEGLLGKVKEIYDKYSPIRKAITDQTDELKTFLMVYEKRVAYDGMADNHYTRIRKLIAAFQQAKLEKKQAAEKEAARRREIEDYKVTLETQIKKNLVEMVMERVVSTDEGSKKHFEKATLANFDEEAKKFMSFKPLLKEEFYNKCFLISFEASKLTKEEFDAFISIMKTNEPFEKWRDLVVDGLVPVLNQWRGKISELKEEKTRIANAKSEEEKARLEQEQKARSAAEENRKKAEFDILKANATKAIDDEAEVNKMGNAFQEQGSVQGLGAKGPTKKTIRFTDDKNIPKPLANAIYHCFLSPKFQVYKLDKEKSPVIDDHGNKVYNEHIQWFLDFFVANCDQNIPGLEVKEVAKVIIRK